MQNKFNEKNQKLAPNGKTILFNGDKFGASNLPIFKYLATTLPEIFK
jgi:hypothetical protein